METNHEIDKSSKINEENIPEEQDLRPEHGECDVEDSDSPQESIKKLETENAELNTKYLRSVADMDNLRKRFVREKSDLQKYGNQKILEDLLPVLDSFEKAMEAQNDANDTSYIEGIKMVLKQLTSVTEKHGLKSFESKGEPFDPNIHQAIQKIDDETVEIERVQEEFQKGYMLNDRLLRAAIVSVSIPTPKE